MNPYPDLHWIGYCHIKIVNGCFGHLSSKEKRGHFVLENQHVMMQFVLKVNRRAVCTLTAMNSCTFQCSRIIDVQITCVIQPSCWFGEWMQKEKFDCVFICTSVHKCVCMQHTLLAQLPLSFESLHSTAMESHSLECNVMYSAAHREKSLPKQSVSAWLLMVLLLQKSFQKEVIVMWDMKLQTSYQQSPSNNANKSSFTSTSQT